MANLPTAADLRTFLEGYDISEIIRVDRLATITSGSDTLTEVEGADDIQTGWRLESDLFPQGTLVTGQDGAAKTVTVDQNASANRANGKVVFVGSEVLTDAWITAQRDNFVVPWVEDKCRLKFTGESQVTEYHSGNGGSILTLNRKPIKSVDSIEVVDTSDESVYSIAVGDLEVLTEYGILKARFDFDRVAFAIPIFPRGELNIKITFTQGYDSDSVPDDVARGVLYLMAEQALGFVAGRTGGGSLNTQGFNRNFGNRGRYTEIRNDLARWGVGALRKWMSGTVGA